MRFANCIALTSCILAIGYAPASAETSLQQQACPKPLDIDRLNPKERFIQKGNRRFDKPGSMQSLRPFQPVSFENRGAIRRVNLTPAAGKLAAITLDLCERKGEVTGFDSRIFAVLKKESIPATLFTGGKWMRSHRHRTEQLMLDPQFEIANHSDTHRNLKHITPVQRQIEIDGPQRTYEGYHNALTLNKCLGPSSPPERMSLFRFPFGICSASSLRTVNDAGLQAIQWDVSTGDPDPRASARTIAHRIVNKTRPGSIILAHANGRGWHTADALRIAVPKLRAQGYRFVTVSELLKRGQPEIAHRCYDLRPGDTDRYDRLTAPSRYIRSLYSKRSRSAAARRRMQRKIRLWALRKKRARVARQHRRKSPAAYRVKQRKSYVRSETIHTR